MQAVGYRFQMDGINRVALFSVSFAASPPILRSVDKSVASKKKVLLTGMIRPIYHGYKLTNHFVICWDLLLPNLLQTGNLAIK